VSNYAPTQPLAAHTWRTRTYIVSGIAGIELLALIAVAIVLLGRGWFEHERANRVAQTRAQQAAAAAKADAKPARPAPTHHSSAPAKPLLTRARTTVLVLNGNGRDGAAGAEASVLRAHRYSVTEVGNAKRNDYAASIVMYRPGYDREARRLSQDLKIPIVSPLDGVRASQLHGARLLLIIGK
jgi:hypothetical protein